MPNRGAVAVLLIQVHHKIKSYNVKKPAEECSFLRSYRVAACSFTKNKTPSQMCFHGLQ